LAVKPRRMTPLQLRDNSTNLMYTCGQKEVFTI
jgi:hypothetical protein